MQTVFDCDPLPPLKESEGWEALRGGVLLIVNVASRCGFTPQYADLQTLQERYREEGFHVLAFPCNDFGSQEPGDNAAIAQFCQSRFGVGFDVFPKVIIRGEPAHPLYRFLESSHLEADAGPSLKAKLFGWFKRFYYGLRGKSLPASYQVGWNFHKFLIAKDGRPVAHFSSTVGPLDEAVLAAIERELARS